MRPLITDGYADLNRQLHASNLRYGAGGARWAEDVRRLAKRVGDDCTILDYGCGKGTLRAALPDLDIRCYDPAFERYSARPEPADLVACTDVLEHIEPELLDNVLEDIALLTRQLAFFVVCMRYAKKRLPDGRNAHLIVRPAPWWVDRISHFFDIEEFIFDPDGEKAKFILRG